MKIHLSLHVKSRHRRHVAWSHKHKIEPKYVQIRLEMLSSPYLSVELVKWTLFTSISQYIYIYIYIYIYDNILLLEGSTCSYKQDPFLDFHICVVDPKFITGIYHKVDDFNFEVISYRFPQSNVHSMLGYSIYHSQLIRFFRLCNNINDFSYRAKFSYSKLVKRGYKHSLLLKYFKRFCSAYHIEGKYGEKHSDVLLSRMFKYSRFVSCNIHNIKEINDIVKSSYVRIKIWGFECEWISKSPLPTGVFDVVNAPLPHT